MRVNRMVRGLAAALFLCLALTPLGGCLTGVTVAGALALVGTVATTASNVTVAVVEARQAIGEQGSLADKLAEFKKQYCARAELRAESREALVEVLVEAGVPDDEAALRVAMAKKLGDRLCGPSADSGGSGAGSIGGFAFADPTDGAVDDARQGLILGALVVADRPGRAADLLGEHGLRPFQRLADRDEIGAGQERVDARSRGVPKGPVIGRVHVGYSAGAARLRCA